MKKISLLIMLIVSVFMFISCESTKQEEKQQEISSSLLPGIESFLKLHPEYGTVIRVKDMPNWARGKRQQVTTGRDTYLFYMQNEEVVGVWRYKGDGAREQIFKKEITELEKSVEKQAFEDLPSYQIIDQLDLINGGKYGDILVPSFSKKTSRVTRESILRRISKKEGFTEATLYCTMDAYKANNSASYLKAHPNALKEGCLGYLKDGKFFELY
ncbi:MAG: hypothetical protein ACFFDN_22885 [Candidatus Hodarchaeota archaeon]